MTPPGTASWRQGTSYITVTSPDGRRWAYDVTPDGDQPLQTFLPPTPWSAYPGAKWEEDDSKVPSVWQVGVFPESAAAALELDVDWPPLPG
jgi:hypothetical protein